MRITPLLAAAAIGLAGSQAGAQAPARTRLVSVNTDSRLWLEGSSNVRDWTCKATTLDAQIELGPDRGAAPVVNGAFVKVPVRSLKCGDRHMEDHMYKALKSANHQFISAKLEALPCSQADTRTVDVTGTLTIAGVEKIIVISVEGERLANGILHARGSLPILMTEYGVTPPRPWGGILRTANKVVIQFEIFVDPRKPAASAESLAAK
jgi:polyisoprenoid-binding protein YceI